MSLELKIEALAQAVIALTAKIEGINVTAAAPVAPAPAPVVQAAPAPVAAPTPAPVVAPVAAAPVAAPAPVAAAPAMPAPPSFIAPTPVAAPASTGAPFTDGKGLIDYVMSAYKALGPQKGAMIQNVLVNLGYQNINDVKPEHYGQLFAGVEALKA
jgi:hypothetical protein